MVNTCGEENFQGVPRFHCTELLLAAKVAGQWRSIGCGALLMFTKQPRSLPHPAAICCWAPLEVAFASSTTIARVGTLSG